MDKAEANNKERADDSTRESLIAISYRLPENEEASAASPKNTRPNGESSPRDGEDKYRSELISISYSPSPDMKAQPSLPADCDA